MSPEPKNTLLKLSPILWTKNLDETIVFYTQVLGFASRSNFPNFVSLYRQQVELMFIIPIDEPEESKDPTNTESFFPKPALTGSLFILTDRVDLLWESIKDKVTIKTRIADREYYMRDFSILDNNGYELVFGQDISPKL